MRKFLTGSFAIAIAVLGLALTSPSVRAASTIDGTLVSISGVTAPATLTVQSGVTTYSVNVTSATVLVRKFGGTSDLAEFGVADLVRVYGTVTGTTIDATKVRDLSIQKLDAAQWGHVLTVDGTAKSFTFASARKNAGTLTVSTNTATKVFEGNRKGTFDDLKVGMVVKIIGVWNKTRHTFTAERILIKLTELEGTVKVVDCTLGAQVLTVQTNHEHGGGATSWTVTLTDTTVLRDKKMSPLTCADVKVNAKVNVRGLRTGVSSVNALNVLVKNVEKSRKVWTGTIASIDGTGMTFVLDQKKGDDRTVTKTGETLFVNSLGTVIAFSHLAVGNKVEIRGTITDDIVTANLVIDKSLPK